SPKWAGGTLASWSDGSAGLIRQVTALYNLLAGYTIEARFDTGLTIRPGLLPQEARFRIEADLIGTGLRDLEVPRQLVLEVDVASKSMKSTGPHPADTRPISFITDIQGTVSIQVDLRPQPGTVTSNSFLTVSRCKGSLQIDLFGDRTVLVPSGSAVPYDLKAMTNPVFGGPVSSVDF